MEGIQLVTDDAGKKVAVQIDLKNHGDLWEDVFDSILARQRAKDPRESIEDVKRLLAREKSCMAEYQIIFARSARKELQSLPVALVQRIFPKIEALSRNPHPRGCRTLNGESHLYRSAWRLPDYLSLCMKMISLLTSSRFDTAEQHTANEVRCLTGE